MSVKDTFAVLKNLFGLAKSVMKFQYRKAKIAMLRNQLAEVDGSIVSKDDQTFDLLKRFLIKRSKQRQEAVTIVLHLIRIVMVSYRLTPVALIKPRGIVFAFLGLLEGVVGLVRLFNFKKQLVKVGSYSASKQKALLKQWKENMKNPMAKQMQVDHFSRQQSMRKSRHEISFLIKQKSEKDMNFHEEASSTHSEENIDDILDFNEEDYKFVHRPTRKMDI